MSGQTPLRTRDKLRKLLGRHPQPQTTVPPNSPASPARPASLGVASPSTYPPSSTSTSTSIPTSSNIPAGTSIPASTGTPASTNSSGARFLETTLQKLAPEEREILLNHAGKPQDITSAIYQAYRAALSKQKVCEDNRWTWIFRGRQVVLRDEAEKVLRGLDRFKVVGDVIANVDPLHIGLPWAGIRVLLEMTTAESHQMAALLTGMRLTSATMNRLEVYFGYSQGLPATLASENLERALVETYAHVLRFLASAIKVYQQGIPTRTWRAIWEPPVIEGFEKDCDKLAARVETEVKACNQELLAHDRDLSAQDREKMKQLKADLDFSLQKLDEIANVQTALENLHLKFDLSRLKTAAGATYDSHADEHSAHCLPGTRKDLLNQVAAWGDDPSGKSIFWLCGKAGTGKSTISRTVADTFNKHGRLGASFFFKRGEGERGNARHFFPTLALQLASRLPLAEHIADALNKDLLLCERRLQTQYEKLLSQPLLSIVQRGQSADLVIVIDALDECDRKDDIGAILRLLAQVDTKGGISLRVFVTSRPETPIQTGFRKMDGALHEDVMLEQVQASTIENDIRIYFHYRFREIQDEYALIQAYDSLPPEWPGNDSIETLVALAVPLFIFAFTVCRYVSDSEPQQRLESLIQPRKATPFSGLDEMYSTILERMLQGQDKYMRDRVVEDFRQIIGSIALLAEPLSALSLSKVLNVPSSVTHKTLQPLHSVMYVPDSSTKPIRMLHLSFRDFLTNGSLEPSNEFFIDEVKAHTRLAHKCLELLSQPGVLCYDLCSVKAPAARRTDFDSDHVSAHIPPEVAYACCYWGSHFLQSKQKIEDGDCVHEFLQSHFLHWLEALSWLGRLFPIINILKELRTLSLGVQASEFVADAHRFLTRQRKTIDLAPLQTYHSALVFAPLESIARQTFKHIVPSSFDVFPTVSTEWGPEIQNLIGHSLVVTAIAYSPDGTIIASSSLDETIILWDAETGEQIKLLRTELRGGSVAFSPDGKTLTFLWSERDLFNFDLDIQTWNVSSGERMSGLLHHRKPSYENAVSPNGQEIAMSFHSRNVLIYSIVSGEQLCCLEGHLFIVTALSFALDGRAIAAGALNGMIRVWDARSGVQMHKLDVQKNRITHIAVSPRHCQILASASKEGTVCLWNASTGETMRVFSNVERHICALAFSPNSRLVALARNGHTMHLWSALETGQSFRIVTSAVAPTSMLSLYAFSPLVDLLAVVSDQKHIELWDTLMCKRKSMLVGHSAGITALGFSPDGSILVSSAPDNTMRLWDTNTGSEKLRIGVLAYVIAFSSDGNTMASQSSTGRLQLWNASTGEELQELRNFRLKIASLRFLGSDSCLAATYTHTSLVVVWDISTGEKILQVHKSPQKMSAITLSRDGQLLAIGSGSGIVEIWDTRTFNKMQNISAHNGEVVALSISRDSKSLISTSADGSSRVWNIETGKQRLELPEFRVNGKSLVFSAAAFSWDGTLVATLFNATMRVQSSTTGKTVWGAHFKDHYLNTRGQELIEFSPDGQQVAQSWSSDMILRSIFNDTQEERRLEGTSHPVSAIAHSPVGHIIASAYADGALQLWDTMLGRKTGTVRGQDPAVFYVDFSEDGQMAASCSIGGSIRIWDVSTGRVKLKLTPFKSCITRLAWSPKGNVLASASHNLLANQYPDLLSDQLLQFWNIQTGVLIHAIRMHLGGIEIVFSPDETIVACRVDSDPVSLYNTQTGQLILSEIAPERSVIAMAISQTNRYVALIGQDDLGKNLLTVLNIQTEERIVEFRIADRQDASFSAVCFSPGDHVIILANESGLCLLKSHTGEITQEVRWPCEDSLVPTWKSYMNPIFSKDGKRVETVSRTFLINWNSDFSQITLLNPKTDLRLVGSWIQNKGQDVLYVPERYRGWCWDHQGDTIAIGHGSGDVNFFRLIA